MAKKRSAKASSAKPTIPQLRRQIDKLDREMLALLTRRAKLAEQIAILKLAADDPIFTPEREDEVLERVSERNKGPLPDHAVQSIYREILSGCRAVKKPLRVAFLGPKNTFSHQAAIHRFGTSVDSLPVGTIAAVFQEVEEGQANFGLVPIENSTDGRISDTLERLASSPARICGEVPLRIHHHLLAACPRDAITQVLSKPQALSQCRNWLSHHLPGAKLVEMASTAEAARLASEQPGTAAVASRQAAAQYQLNIVAEQIEDDPENLTRFAVIGPESAKRTGDDKTSLLFEIDHRPGALADALNLLKRNRLNMTWIESFPIPRSPGRYLFFVELVGHQQDVRVRRTITSLEKKAVRLEILGSYARMEPVG